MQARPQAQPQPGLVAAAVGVGMGSGVLVWSTPLKLPFSPNSSRSEVLAAAVESHFGSSPSHKNMRSFGLFGCAKGEMAVTRYPKVSLVFPLGGFRCCGVCTGVNSSEILLHSLLGDCPLEHILRFFSGSKNIQHHPSGSA